MGCRVDDQVTNIGKVRRKGLAQQIRSRRRCILVSFPVEVVVMGNGRDPRLADHPLERQAQGQIHRDGKHILRNNEIEGVLAYESAQRFR